MYNNIKIDMPENGQNKTYSIAEDDSARLSLDASDINGVALGDDGELVINLTNGGQITLVNFQNFTDSGNFIYLDDGTLLNFSSLMQAPSEEALTGSDETIITTQMTESASHASDVCEIDPSQITTLNEENELVVKLADGTEVPIDGTFQSIAKEMMVCEMVVVQPEEILTETTTADQQLAQRAANIAPAAGEDVMAQIAEELANIDPEAGDGSSSNTGFGFNSSPTAAPFDAPNDIGPLGPTQLSYIAPVVDVERFFFENPDDNPSILFANEIVDETNFDNGNLIQEGRIIVDFGNDGAGSIRGNNNFVSTDPLGDINLTSGGRPVIVTFDAATNTYIGSIESSIATFATPATFASFSIARAVAPSPSVNSQATQSTTVFTFEIDPATGEYVYTQIEPFDHANTLDPDDELFLDFGVTVRDRDGDSASNFVRVTVRDDGPEIGSITRAVDETDINGNHPVIATGKVPGDFGEDGAGAFTPNGLFSFVPQIGGPIGQLTSGGHAVHVKTTENGYIGKVGSQTIFTLDIDPTNGEFVYKQFAGIDHPDSNNPNDIVWLKFYVDITDRDGDTDTGTIVIDVFDDGPSVVNAVRAIDETNLLGQHEISVHGQVDGDFGTDGPGTLTSNGSFTFLTQSSGTHQQLTSGGQAVHVTETSNGYVGKIGNTVIFTLDINQHTGQFKYTQFKAIDHPNTHDPNDAVWLKFGIDITDADGDKNTGFIQIDVLDDGPNVGNIVRSIDESDLANQHEINVHGTVENNFGTDGAGSISANDKFTFLTSVGGSRQQLTSGGDPVHVTQNGDGYIGTVGSKTIFTLTINPPTGDFKYTQFEAIDHPDGTDPNDAVWLKFGITITDADGDKNNGHIQIDVRDDGPNANDDSNSVLLSQQTTATGNVLTNDSFGVDGMGSLLTTGTLQGDFGVLQLNSNGSYTYTRGGDAGGTDTFDYTIRDADGDTDTATLSIDVAAISPPPPPPPPIFSPPPVGGDGDGDGGGDGCPIVLDLDGDGIDNNGDGHINHEDLVGDATTDGFSELGSYNSNGDGVVDANDDAWSELRAWRDLNQDGISQEGELFTMEEVGITSLSLGTTQTDYYNNGSWVPVEGSFTRTDGT